MKFKKLVLHLLTYFLVPFIWGLAQGFMNHDFDGEYYHFFGFNISSLVIPPFGAALVGFIISLKAIEQKYSQAIAFGLVLVSIDILIYLTIELFPTAKDLYDSLMGIYIPDPFLIQVTSSLIVLPAAVFGTWLGLKLNRKKHTEV